MLVLNGPPSDIQPVSDPALWNFSSVWIRAEPAPQSLGATPETPGQNPSVPL